LQRQRRDALPASEVLRTRLRAALVGLPLRATARALPRALERTRRDPLVDRSGLAGTSLASGVDALLAQRAIASWHCWPLRAPAVGPHPFAIIDAAHVKCRAGVAPPGVSIALLDLKHESTPCMPLIKPRHSLSSLGFGVIAAIAPELRFRRAGPTGDRAADTRGSRRYGRIGREPAGADHTAPDGLLLIVAVGSNYALFF